MSATHDKKKLQKLTDLDFSKAGHHMALVTRGANGEEVPLIVKNLTKGDMYNGNDETPSGLGCNLSLEDVLMLVFGGWRKEEATLIANSIVKSLDQKQAEAIHALISKNLNLEASPSGVAAKTPTVTKLADNKNIDNSGATMTDTIKPAPDASEQISKAEVDSIISKAVTAAVEVATKPLIEKLEKFEKDDELRKDAHFAVQAVEFKALGVTEADAAVFKALSGTPHGDRVTAILKSAKDVVAKAAHLDPLGKDGNSDATPTAMDQLKVIAKKIEQDEKVTPQQAMTLAATRNPKLVG